MDGMKAVIECKCGAENAEGRFFCRKCGRLLNGQRFSSEALYETEELKLCRIIENLQHTPHERIVWDDTVDLYARKAEQYLSMLDLPELENNQARADLEQFLALCRNPEFQIAFVGTIKTGKSTLINALLGNNYASMAVTPETAALTRFRSSPKDYVHITFYSPSEWETLWASRTSGADAFMKEYQALDAESQRAMWVGHPPYHKELANSEIEKELQIWSSSKRAEHYFVKEIEVGISNLPQEIPHQVVFVDTPGLSDPVAYRSEITRKYIQRANAVFVCVDAQKIQKEEIETIASVFSFSSHNPGKVHIIATHWDKLNNPEADWEEQKRWVVQRLTGKGFFPNQELADRNIRYAAAYVYNHCRDFAHLTQKERIGLAMLGNLLDIEFNPYDLESIQENLERLMQISNIDNIRNVIMEELAGPSADLLFEELREKYLHIVSNLRRFAGEGRIQQQSFIKATEASFQEVQKKIEIQKQNYEEITQYRKQLLAVLQTTEKTTQKRLDRIVETIDRLIKSR